MKLPFAQPAWRALLAAGIAVYQLSCSMAQAGTQATFYVDPVHGSDSAAGTLTNNAFQTIGRAVQEVRTINASMSGDIVIYLRGGTYLVTNTISLTAADSGNNGYNIIYTAYPNETPIISGGRQISGWTLFDTNKNIYQAAVDPSLAFRQIYVNGQRGVRARSPNLTNNATFAGYYRAISSSPFVVNSADVGGWSNLNQVECVWIAHWHEKRARLSSVTVNGTQATLNFMEPEASSPVLNQFPQPKTWYYFENAYEFLDQEGERYLNTTTHTLFYKPRAGEDPNSMVVIVPTVETLLNLTGTPSAYIHNVQFKGIIFEYSNWTAPDSYGYLNWQAGVQLETDGNNPIPGMVQIDYGSQIVMENCVFRFSGAHALTTIHNTSSNLFEGNVFTNLAGGGIYMNTAQEDGASTYDTIRDNLFDGVGQVYSDCVAILVPNVAHDLIEHNVVRNCPYTGISVGWSWDDGDHGCYDNTIQYNLVHDVMQLHDDGGGIYSLGRMSNGFVSGNYIYNLSPSPYQGGYPLAAIYLDNGSCFKTVQSNVCDRTQAAFYAYNPPNCDNTFQYNYYNVPLGSIASSNIIGINYSVAQSSGWPLTALNWMIQAGLEPEYRDIDPLAQPGGLQLGRHLLILSKRSFTFDIAGLSNSIVAVQKSSDLISWQSLFTNQLTSANVNVTNSGGMPSAFYRAVQLQP